ncbi:hypothetical protein N9B94_03140, partial [Verrucomicrobia bacterium]|nr:hypothetical protein [Verrucomicrobiota bacterium]
SVPPLALGGVSNFGLSAIIPPTDTERPEVRFSAGDVIPTEGFDSVLVEILADVRGAESMRVFLMNLSVHALDGSPSLTDQVTFQPVSGLGAPEHSSTHEGLGNYSAAWLDPSVSGFNPGENRIGWLHVKMPSGATSQSSYCVSFQRVSASPNGYGLMRYRTKSGLITMSDRNESSFGDNIPDLWRLRNFGSALNVLSHADADADGDGVPNWKEYRAGTHPNDRLSRLALAPEVDGNILRLRFPTADAKRYVIESSDSLFGDWEVVSSLFEGDGDMMEHAETNDGETRFYRVRLIESQ